MAENTGKMICPRCKIGMNHHCDKMVFGGDSRGDAPADPVLGGTMTEFHSCPNCGMAGCRPAQP